MIGMQEQSQRDECARERERRQTALRRRVTEAMPPTGSVGPIDSSHTSTSTLLTAGALSGGASKLLTAPVDRIKIIYQVRENGKPYSHGPVNARSHRAQARPSAQVNSDPLHTFTVRRGLATARQIVVDSGVLALWRGNSAAIARDVPYASIVFASYAMYEDKLLIAAGHPLGASGGGTLWSRLAAGSAAGATATFLTYPLDLMRARLAADSRSLHQGCALNRKAVASPNTVPAHLPVPSIGTTR